MKGLNLMRWCVLGVFLCLFVETVAQKQVGVECRIDDEVRLNRENEVKLYREEQGEMVEKTWGKYTDEGAFIFSFVPEYEGFYMVGEKDGYCCPVWLKSGDRVSVRIDREGGHLYGRKNSRENKTLYKWQELVREVRCLTMPGMMSQYCTYEEFFRKFEVLIKETDRFKGVIWTRNVFF